MPAPFNLIYYLKEFAFFPQGEEEKLTLQAVTLLTAVNYLRGFLKASPLSLYSLGRNKDNWKAEDRHANGPCCGLGRTGHWGTRGLSDPAVADLGHKHGVIR